MKWTPRVIFILVLILHADLSRADFDASSYGTLLRSWFADAGAFTDAGGTTSASVNDRVAGWKDTKNNVLAINTDGVGPILKQDGSGRHYLDFSGTFSYLKSAGTNVSGLDVTTVMILTYTGSGDGAAYGYGTACLVFHSGSGVRYYPDATGVTSLAIPGWDPSAIFTTAIVDSKQNGDLTIWTDGSQRVNTTSGTTPAGALDIGQFNDDSGTSSSWNFYAFLVYQGSLTDRAGLEAAINTYMGVSSAPTAPSDTAAYVQSSSQVDLTWTDNSPDETGFSIDYVASATEDFTGATTVTAAADAISKSITSLNEGTKYWFRVKATGSSGDSAYDTSVSVTLKPSTPTISVTSATANLITFSVDQVSTHATGMSFQYAAHGTAFASPIETIDIPNGTTSITPSADLSSGRYDARIQNYVGFDATSDWSGSVSFSVGSSGRPGPAGLNLGIRIGL